jgi:CRISPR-associated protein Cas5t
MLYLRIKAPFAAFRSFTAGSYRPTAPFITPSAAYGFLMNIAGIETRWDDGESPMTLTANNLPSLEIAIGAVSFPERQTIYQQLHNYPVGSSAKEHEEVCWGSKYNIQPIRREFLSGIDACIAVKGDDVTEQKIRDGLNEGYRTKRYGILFLGDNSFLPDVIREITEPVEAHWFIRLSRDASGPKDRLCRLTVMIDRADMSNTKTLLFYPTEQKIGQIPDDAWCMVGHVTNANG